MSILKGLPLRPGRTLIGGAPAGYDALVLAELAQGREVLFVARDDGQLAATAEALAFFAPGLERLEFPAWDCLPYDRVSPNGEIVARRIDCLTRLLDEPVGKGGRLVLTTVAALAQRVPPRAAFKGASLKIAIGDRRAPDDLAAFLVGNGYGRAETVMEPGEFALRGGILDVYPPGAPQPLRLDFFGDELDGIRTFDPVSQRTSGKAEAAVLKPVSEVPLDEAAVSRFRSGYRALVGGGAAADPLYESVSAGRRHMGMEHWLPLFHEGLETLLDYLPAAAVVLDHQAEEARDSRSDQIDEYYSARRSTAETAYGGAPYHPVPPASLFLDAAGWGDLLSGRAVVQLSPFGVPEETGLDAGGRGGKDFADARLQTGVNLFEAVKVHVAQEQLAGRRVVLTAFTHGSRDRLGNVLHEHGLEAAVPAETWAAALALPETAVPVVVVGLEKGFVTPDLAVIGEQDILGDRLVRPRRAKVKPEDIIADAASLTEGDLVVHVDHGIGRYDGLETLSVLGAPHDCLRLVYDGGDKLYLPVENIELISRYGSETAGVQLDKLGGAAWQARKARLKQRIREMADELIKVAAVRALQQAAPLPAPEGLFDEFCARFAYTETDDQRRAIDDTIEDLASGKPTDRLVCGDVGFGKTEVALRAAFVAALGGRQVAVVVPTTLLCRQHYRTFLERFRDLPVRIEQLSRMVTPKQAKETKQGLKDGTVEIVIGTHALLAGDIDFRDLGLLIIDEEQHFGVAHKEKLKKLKSDVHVVTLTATPIPRTLQLAMSGVREMSIIATPPVDRLVVRTFVLPFDPVVIREAVLRERYRGGQTFYVCPRIEDLDEVAGQLRDILPELKFEAVHGRMPVRELEDKITAFSEGKFDILLSTNIIESGLDMPRVNTIVVHRADMFGLAQLYQLRGRVGRSKLRAYAYLTLPPKQKLSKAAERRLEVMQTLDTLGAGFSLASHDLDIRGAGNLLGEEQSGHIREVGIELYQQMLEEAVREARDRGGAGGFEEEWSPQISTGMPVLIPDTYVADLAVRLDLYRRIARLATPADLESFAAEMIDRFGKLPAEAENLLKTVAVKQLCRRAGVEKVEAGPKGAVVAFRNNQFANPAGLVGWLQTQAGTAKLRPDHKLVLMRNWETPAERMAGIHKLLDSLAGI